MTDGFTGSGDNFNQQADFRAQCMRGTLLLNEVLSECFAFHGVMSKCEGVSVGEVDSVSKTQSASALEMISKVLRERLGWAATRLSSRCI